MHSPHKKTLTAPPGSVFTATIAISNLAHQKKTAKKIFTEKDIVQAQIGDWFSLAAMALMMFLALEQRGATPKKPSDSHFSSLVDRLRQSFSTHSSQEEKKPFASKVLDALEDYLNTNDDPYQSQPSLPLDGNQKPIQNGLLRTVFVLLKLIQTSTPEPSSSLETHKECEARLSRMVLSMLHAAQWELFRAKTSR